MNKVWGGGGGGGWAELKLRAEIFFTKLARNSSHGVFAN